MQRWDGLLEKKIIFVLAGQGHSGAKPLTRISFQPEEEIVKPAMCLSGFSLLKEVSTKYLVVEFAVY